MKFKIKLRKLKVSNKCNNNCIFCNPLNLKEKYDKSFEEIKKEIYSLKEKNYDEIILPCNSDIREDFTELLKYAKSLNFKITLETNGRMFYYKDFCDKTFHLIDDYHIMLFSINNRIHNILTKTTNTLHQTIKGIENISSLNRHFDITLFLGRINSGNLVATVSYLKNIKNLRNIQIKISEPHPEVYQKLNEINSEKKLKIIDLPCEIKFEITPKCNLNCNFCFNENSFSRDFKELSKKQIFKAIDKITEAGIKKIRFTGGEPFLRKDFFEILHYAKSSDLHVMVNTNSMLIKKQEVHQLSKFVDTIVLSFHSLDKEEITKKIELIEIMKKTGILVWLNTILIKENIAKLENFFEIINKLAVMWFLERPVPTATNKTLINNEDIKSVVEKLITFKNKQSFFSVVGIPFCAYDPEKIKLFSRGAQFCGIFNKLVIDPTGKIKPCYSINEKIGNIYTDELSKIWIKGLSHDIRALEIFPNICKKCKYLYDCLGGCRFAAKLINGSYDSMDPLAKPQEYLP